MNWILYFSTLLVLVTLPTLILAIAYVIDEEWMMEAFVWSFVICLSGCVLLGAIGVAYGVIGVIG